jgi:hypothetical protein
MERILMETIHSRGEAYLANTISMALLPVHLPKDAPEGIIVEEGLLPEAEMSASQGKRFGKAIVQDNMLFLFGFFRSKNPKVDY